jgi:hypothetical protein
MEKYKKGLNCIEYSKPNDKKIKVFNINKMWGLGTPEDLNNFLKK